MLNTLSSAVLLAQNDAAAPPAVSPLLTMLPALAIIFAIFYVVIILPERKKQKSRQGLLDALKKNDRVVTIGGVCGVVASVNRDRNEVVLKVDESNNTKLVFTVSAIDHVVAEGEKNEAT